MVIAKKELSHHMILMETKPVPNLAYLYNMG